ncbi:glycosyltransferase 87 family protein [Actinacidiphila rubida]
MHTVTKPRIGGPGGAVAAWAATRAALLVFVFQVVRFPGQVVVHDVEDIYRGWYPVLRTGAFPAHDVAWQYPPGAAVPLLAPGGLPFLGYASAFFVLALLADAVVLGALLRDARHSGRMAGVWVWIGGTTLLGPIVYARYDVMVTAVAVPALLALRRRPALAGALAGFGGLLKLWPLLVLIGAPTSRTLRRSWAAAAATVAVLLGLSAALMRNSMSFLAFQQHRGTEVESLGAMVFHVARHLGWHGRVEMHYGSMEFLGPHVHLVSAAALGLSVLGVCWLAWWRLRARRFTAATPYDAAFTALLVFTTTSRVISPQYMVWLVGAGAVCAAARGTVLRLPLLLTLAAALFTTLEFPPFFSHVTAGDAWGLLLLGTRNALLVTASVMSCRRLWAATVPARTPGPTRPEPAEPDPRSTVLTP